MAEAWSTYQVLLQSLHLERIKMYNTVVLDIYLVSEFFKINKFLKFVYFEKIK